MNAEFAGTPVPPYYAVIFTSMRTEGDHGYEAMAAKMFDLAKRQPGCLGAESARNDNGFGITVAYFTDETAVRAWKQNSVHVIASGSVRSAGIPGTNCVSQRLSEIMGDRPADESRRPSSDRAVEQSGPNRLNPRLTLFGDLDSIHQGSRSLTASSFQAPRGDLQLAKGTVEMVHQG